MEFFHHQSIRKYTASLLDTFNDIYFLRQDKDGKDIYVNVPVTFGSKDRAYVMSQIDLDAWKNGNYNILPRMSLSLISIEADQKRNTNRLHTINKTINNDTINFQYNAVAYNLNYELDIATKSLTELSMVLEQILPYFNPTLNLNIMELEFLNEPTSVKVNLNSTSLDLPDSFQMEDALRIVGAKLNLTLAGNLYMPYRDAEIIKQVRLYINSQRSDELLGQTDRKSKLEFEVDKDSHQMKGDTLYKLDFEDTKGKNRPNYWYNILPDGSAQRDEYHVPILIDDGLYIDGSSQVSAEDRVEYTIKYVDIDDEIHTFIWNVLSGQAIIQQNNVNPVKILFGGVGTVLLQGQVMDKKGNLSKYVTKEIIVQ